MELKNRKELLHPEVEKYILELETKLEDEQMKMLDLCAESLTVGFGKEQATIWKASIEKPLLEKVEKYSKENVELNLNFAILKNKYDELKFRMDGLEK